MPAAKIIINEQDLSTTAPSFAGAVGALILPNSPKGIHDDAFLCSSEDEFLKEFTVDNRIPVGADVAYFSGLTYLAKSQTLWVARASNNPLFGGIIVPKVTSTTTEIRPVDSGMVIPSDFSFTVQDSFLLHSVNPGTWNSSISAKVEPNVTEAAEIYAFDLVIYFKGVEKERFTVSRDPNAKDGYNNNIYIEDRLVSSNYVRAVDNTLIPHTELPKFSNATSVAFSPSVAITRNFASAKPAVAQQQSFTVLGGNTTGSQIRVTVGTTDIDILATDTTADAVASRIAGDVTLTGIATIEEVNDNSNIVTITNTVAAGSSALVALSRPESIRSSGYTLDTAFATGVDAKVVSFTITNGNTSGIAEDFVLFGIETVVSAASVTPTQVATAIAASDYSGEATLTSVTSVGAVVTVTFTLAAGDAANPAKTVPSTVSFSTPAVTRAFVVAVIAVAQQQTFSVIAGNTSGAEETVTVAGIEIAIPLASDLASEAATNIAAADFSSVTEISTVTALNNDVVITFTAAATNVALITIDDGSQPSGLILGQGSNGAPVGDGDMVMALGRFKGIAITLFMDGGRTTAAYQKALIAEAEKRHLSMALLSTPIQAENSTNWKNELRTWRNETLNANSSHAAIYTPHVKVLDKFNNRNIFVSPESYPAGIISSNTNLWTTPAGFDYPLNVLDTNIRFDDTPGADLDYLVDLGINPIRFTAGEGIVIWGERTTFSRPSDLRNITTRLLLIVVETAITAALKMYHFKENTVDSRREIKGIIDSYMSTIKGANGVYEFESKVISTDNDIENEKLRVYLFIKVIKTSKIIEFSPVLTRYGLDFSDAFGRVA